MPSGPGSLLAEIAEHGDVGTVVGAVRDAVRSWVGVGPVFLATADPASGAFTATFTFDIPDDAAAAFYTIEAAGTDVASFSSLSSTVSGQQSLYTATGAHPQSSRRWREVIEPLGWGDELRAVIRAQGVTWGYLCLHRDAADTPFRRRDADRLETLLPAIASAMRRAAIPAPADAVALPTGVLVLDEKLRLAGATGGAEPWLDEIRHASSTDGLPLLLRALAAHVHDSGVASSTTITTRTGRIGLVEAAPLHTGTTRQVAIVISAASIRHRLERFAAATRLTSRETEVVRAVLTGISTSAIAGRLDISPGTVQAHLTSVFAKTESRTRRELIARLMG